MRKADKRARGEQRQQVYKDQAAASGQAAIKAANKQRALKQARAREEKQHKNARKAINGMRNIKDNAADVSGVYDEIQEI